MSYRTIYDLHEQPPFSTTWALISAGIIVLGIVVGRVQRARDRRLGNPPRKGITTARILIVFGSLCALIGVGMLSFDHWRLLKALDAGEAAVVEGPIQSWGTERVRTGNIKKHEYHTYERFYVGDSIWFGYYWEVGQAGFHNGPKPRVEFSDGMQVRATYLWADGQDAPPRIVKLEVAE
jgi:heme/copper-type cytochrome/quinol oxidase subunit 2